MCIGCQAMIRRVRLMLPSCLGQNVSNASWVSGKLLWQGRIPLAVVVVAYPFQACTHHTQDEIHAAQLFVPQFV